MTVRWRPLILSASAGTLAMALASLIKIGLAPRLAAPLIDVGTWIGGGFSPAAMTRSRLWLAALVGIYVGVGLLYALLQGRESATCRDTIPGGILAAIAANVVGGLVGAVASVAFVPIYYTPEITGLSQELIDASMGMAIGGAVIEGVLGICVGGALAAMLGAAGSVFGALLARLRP